MLSSVPGVCGVCTVVRESAAGNKLLVGYVAGDVDAQDLRAVAAERMPASLVPLIVVDELPVATSGKVDRKALPWPPPTDPDAGGEGDAALTQAERELAVRWREQLGPVALDADSDFFALGGTSLAAAKLVSVLRAEHPAIAVADIYSHRTLRELAARLQTIGAIDTSSELELSPGPMRRLGLMQLFGVLVLFAVQSVPCCSERSRTATSRTSAPRTSAGSGSARLGSCSPARPRGSHYSSCARASFCGTCDPAGIRGTRRSPPACGSSTGWLRSLDSTALAEPVGRPLCPARGRRRPQGRAPGHGAAGGGAAAHRRRCDHRVERRPARLVDGRTGACGRRDPDRGARGSPRACSSTRAR